METDTIREALHVQGYASVFNVADLNGDIVRPGAFSRCIGSRSAREVKALFQHEASEPVGVWDEIREDGTGLFVRGRILMATPRGRATASLIEQGAVDGLSIGFRTLRFTPRREGGRELLQLDLWEVSVVTFPMLPQARLTLAATEEAA